MKDVTPITLRKSEHIRINLEEDVQSGLTSGLEQFHFIHQALPEINLCDVDPSVTIFGKVLSSPILISSMTGGTAEASTINHALATAAQEMHIAMGVGSQRIALEHPEFADTFKVRQAAPDILLFANLGAIQLNYGYGIGECKQAVEMIEADALILHFNSLQEALQNEGDTQFEDLLKKVETICKALTVPVIAKEVGWGFSKQDIYRLTQAGVKAIDVAGAGGTSWSQVEMYRAEDEFRRKLAAAFSDWGIPTVDVIQNVTQVAPGLLIIASGGLRSGVDIAKCVAMGASLGGMAGPFLKSASQSIEETIKLIKLIREEICICMFATGSKTLKQLRHDKLAKKNNLMPPNPIEDITQTYLETIETELHHAVERAKEFGNTKLYDMLAYHMGWQGTQNPVKVRGKRIRPLLVLLCCTAAGGNWNHALPGATAVELVHNFSLIHDDIEDRSPVRRGRPTIWKIWGVPQAINTGDAMFALAHLEAVRIAKTASPFVALKAVEILQYTCLHLTQGQYLDLSYELRTDLRIEDYWQMVEGKTAALIGVSTQLGALAAFSSDQTSEFYYKFGRLLGLAFQVQDDFLGIWGDSSLTGKSSQSDLVTGKITLPVLYGLSKGDKFAARWMDRKIHPDEVPEIISLLENEGVKEFVQSQANDLINEALSALEKAHPSGIAGDALSNLALKLVNRQI